MPVPMYVQASSPTPSWLTATSYTYEPPIHQRRIQRKGKSSNETTSWRAWTLLLLNSHYWTLKSFQKHLKPLRLGTKEMFLDPTERPKVYPSFQTLGLASNSVRHCLDFSIMHPYIRILPFGHLDPKELPKVPPDTPDSKGLAPKSVRHCCSV